MSQKFEQEDHQAQKDINFSIHMHPMTLLRSPDLLDQGKDSMFQITCGILYSSLPLILCFELNVISSIINIYLIGNYGSSQQMAAVGLGTILANIFGFMVIQNLSVGFSVLCSYFQQKEQVGFMYQKTLGINFFICILVTPLLYLSDKALILLGFNEQIVGLSGTYVWALVPSFYMYSFYETTKNYLQSQGVIYPCLVIGSVSAILHYLMASFMIIKLDLGIMGAAWSKNISYMLSCLVLYLYIIKVQPTKQSWIQWNIRATNNVHGFLARILTHQMLTYFEALAFQILCVIACYLWEPHTISAHFSISNTLIIIYFMNISISHCLNKSLMISISQNDTRMFKKKFTLGITIIIIFSLVIAINLWFNQEIIISLFSSDEKTKAAMSSVFSIFLGIVFLDGLQISLFGVLKTLYFTKIWRLSTFSFYFIGLLSAIFFAFYMQWQLKGIWCGWLLGIIVSLIFELKILVKIDLENDLEQIRENYKKDIDAIKERKFELSSYKRLS